MRVLVIEVLGAEARDTGTFTRGNTLEPYPAECVAAVAEAIGFTAEVLQIGSLTDDQIMERIRNYDPMCVGMTVFTHSLSRAQSLAMMIKAFKSSIVTVVGGYHPSLCPECTLGSFDFVVLGEGEVTFGELLLNLVSNDKPWREIAGLAFEEKGELVVTIPRERVRNLDTLPWAKRVPEYLRNAKAYGLMLPSPDNQTAMAEVSCSRGCSNRCRFCVSSLMWNDRHGIAHGSECSVTLRSPENVAAEIRQLHEFYGVNCLYLTDLTFNQSVDRVCEISEALIAAGLHSSPEADLHHVHNSVHWYALVKVGIDAGTARIMAAAGCSRVGMGIETFSEEQAKAYNKPCPDLVKVKNSLTALDEAGIITRALIIFGAPGESRTTAEETVRGLKEFAVDQVRLPYLTPFPGTQLANDLPSEILDPDWDRYDTETPVVDCGLSHQELKELREYIGHAFYGSNVYSDRCRNKLARFPHLAQSYRWWFNYLYEHGFADLRSMVR